MLLRPPPPFALETHSMEYATPQETRRSKWKQWLAKSLYEAKTRRNNAQKRYKRNFDTSLQNQREEGAEDDYIYINVELPVENHHCHKLAVLPAGPYLVLE